jgi:23S rRNA-/tRNA-specific pseudouridylate synthase
MKYLNTPIVGDRVYGKAGKRLFLHAYRLEITIRPEERRTFIAPIPEQFHDMAGGIDEALLG